MKEITIKVYEFNELSDKAKEKAREWFKKDIVNEDYWKDYVYEDAMTIANLLGIEIKNIYFSGFWSQGDGACFEGTFRASNLKVGKVKEYASQDKELHKIAEEFERIANANHSLYFKTTHNDRYYHENSVDFDFGFSQDTDETEDYNIEGELVKDCKEVAKQFMRWIYKQLEKAYDYENSNECVDENIISNEYTFTIDGKRF